LNHCIKLRIVPTKLKLAKVIPVFKKEASDQLNSYRPISQLTYLSKMFERIIYNRLLSLFNRNDILIPTQYRFRHKQSTIYACYY